MTEPLRLLLVDDSKVVRTMLFKLLAGRADIDIVGKLEDGESALKLIRENRCNVVLLDLAMPGLDGFGVLRELKRTGPQVDVIVLSALTKRGAMETLEALSLGALDYMLKPTAEDDLDLFSERLHQKLDAVRVRLSKSTRKAVRSETTAATPGLDHQSDRPRSPLHAIALGASTGGPNALQDVLLRLPRPLTVPVFIVQHMPAVFTQPLADSLSARTGLPVREAQQGESPRPGHVYVAPGGVHLIVRRVGATYLMALNEEPVRNGCRPAVDVLFESVATAYGQHAAVALLTGMGRDGVDGCDAIRKSGGFVILQDEATSVVWGMPGVAAQAGLGHLVLPLTEIGPALGKTETTFATR